MLASVGIKLPMASLDADDNRRKIGFTDASSAGTVAPAAVSQSPALGLYGVELSYANGVAVADYVAVRLSFRSTLPMAGGTDSVSLVLTQFAGADKAAGQINAAMVRDSPSVDADASTWTEASKTLSLAVASPVAADSLTTVHLVGTGLRVGGAGIAASSLQLGFAGSVTLAASAVVSAAAVEPGFSGTSLSFSPTTPGTATRIDLGFVHGRAMTENDKVRLKLPGFTGPSRP